MAPISRRIVVTALVVGMTGAAGVPGPAEATPRSFPADAGWVNPVPSATYEDHDFAACPNSYDTDQRDPHLTHLGADSQTPLDAGSPFVALAPGTVLGSESWGSWGSALAVEHSSDGGRFVAVYGHVHPGVAPGTSVTGGQRLGTMYDLEGNTHLHLGIRPLRAGESATGVPIVGNADCPDPVTHRYVDPIPWLATRSPAAAERPGTSFDLEVAGDGRAWLLGVDAHGTLLTRSALGGSWGKWRQHGRAGSWTAADLGAASSGGVRVVAVKKSGTMYTRLGSADDWSGFYRHDRGPWESADIEIAPDGRAWVLGIDARGTLLTRSAFGGAWGKWRQHGRAASWAAADVEVARSGGVRLVAIKKSGTMYTRLGSADDWSGFYRHERGPWESADIEMAPDGRVWLLGVDARGTMLSRSAFGGAWGKWRQHGDAGSWSR